MVSRLRSTRGQPRLLPVMRKRGTTVCRSDVLSGNTLKGYVEDSTDEKIQIRVPNFKPGGFQPQVIWGYPAEWRLC